MNSSQAETGSRPAARWQALPSLERRVLGVLIEKAKTTPDQYPMSLNGLRVGCNQKSNRFPLMEIEDDDVQRALDHLKQVGAAAEVQGAGRVPRFRHLAYEWLGVDKVELAVMAELLLRGTQTEGELRGRASRMETIADLTALRGVLHSLKDKGLVLPLTPEGRGHMLTHALYLPRELEKVRTDARATAVSEADDDVQSTTSDDGPLAPRGATAAGGAPAALFSAVTREAIESMRLEIIELRRSLAEMGEQMDDCRREIRELRSELGG